MASVAEYRPGAGQAAFPDHVVPHRKPLPHQHLGPPPQLPPPPPKVIPVRMNPEHQYVVPQQPPPRSHGHTRSASSTAYPPMDNYAAVNQSQSTYQQPPNPIYQPKADQRALSIATTSTAVSSNAAATTPGSTGSSYLHRTTSSQSGNTPLSYVALMRKQKATVWCDRSQPEDPALVRQQKIARERALREVASGNAARYGSGSSSLTGGVRSKIRHHAPKAQMYTPSSHPASGVPMRLSANEVDEDDSDEESRTKSFGHVRTSSERSSLGSATRMSSQFGQSNSGRVSAGGTPPSGHSHSPSGFPRTASSLEDETPVPDQTRRKDYFSQAGGQGVSGGSAGSSGSEGREDSFGRLGQIPQRRPQSLEPKTEEELRRRGSVDDRTSTMTGYGKLFVANPDVE